VGLGRDFAFPSGPIYARSVVAAHLDLTVVRLFSSNKTGDLLPLNPSALAFLSSLPDSMAPHGETEATGNQNGEHWHHRGPPHQCVRPPMGRRATVERLLDGFYPRTPTSIPRYINLERASTSGGSSSSRAVRRSAASGGSRGE
jgi:hypothetical protein